MRMRVFFTNRIYEQKRCRKHPMLVVQLISGVNYVILIELRNLSFYGHGIFDSNLFSQIYRMKNFGGIEQTPSPTHPNAFRHETN